MNTSIYAFFLLFQITITFSAVKGFGFFYQMIFVELIGKFARVKFFASSQEQY